MSRRKPPALDLAAMLLSWELALRAERKSAQTIKSYAAVWRSRCGPARGRRGGQPRPAIPHSPPRSRTCDRGAHARIREVLSITIEPTAAYAGHTRFRSKPCDSAFIAYAGPWAEARAQWPAELPLDAEDDDGCTFDDYLAAAWMANADGDLADYERACEADAALLGSFAHMLPSREETWRCELEGHWPMIQELADELIA